MKLIIDFVKNKVLPAQVMQFIEFVKHSAHYGAHAAHSDVISPSSQYPAIPVHLQSVANSEPYGVKDVKIFLLNAQPITF